MGVSHVKDSAGHYFRFSVLMLEQKIGSNNLGVNVALADLQYQAPL